jgi:hypothetical protein
MKFKNEFKKGKLRVGRIRPEAKGLLGAAAGCPLLRQPAVTASRPNWRGPTATRLGRLRHDAARTHHPWSPRGGHAHGSGLARLATSNRASMCGEIGGDSSSKKRGRCRARRDRRGHTETTAQRRAGGVGSGRMCSVGGVAPVIFGVLSSCTGVNEGVRPWLQLDRVARIHSSPVKAGRRRRLQNRQGGAWCSVPERPCELSAR